MKSPLPALIKAHSVLLNTLNLTGWSVHDGGAPPNVTGNVIIISSRHAGQSPDKNTFDTDCSVTIEFIVRDEKFGYKKAQDKANEYTELLDSDNQLNLAPDFKCDTTIMASMNTRESLNPADNQRDVIVRFDHNISQR